MRQDPSLISAAINEAVRLESPIRGFTRVVVEETVWDSVKLSAGSRILAICLGQSRRTQMAGA